jgi:hypothetical protein
MECSFQGPDEGDDGGMVIFFGELDPGSQENEDCVVTKFFSPKKSARWEIWRSRSGPSYRNTYPRGQDGNDSRIDWTQTCALENTENE